ATTPSTRLREGVRRRTCPRHGAYTMPGHTRSPDWAGKRRRGRGVPPTWRVNGVGTETFPRHGAKTTSGQRHYPDMAQKRRRDRGITPTGHKNDVGTEGRNLFTTTYKERCLIMSQRSTEGCLSLFDESDV